MNVTAPTSEPTPVVLTLQDPSYQDALECRLRHLRDLTLLISVDSGNALDGNWAVSGVTRDSCLGLANRLAEESLELFQAMIDGRAER